MTRILASISLAMVVCAGAQAATVNTTLTVNATGSIGLTGISVTGTATLTSIGSGTFAGTASLTPDSAGNLSAPFTITLTTGGPGTIIGTLTIPFAALTGPPPLTGSATITGGTGNFAGAMGSFPSLTGTGSLGLTITLSFSGAGSITTGGTPPPPVPTITAVLNAASNTPGIAQGAIFIVKGSNLSASGVTSFDVPRPTQSSGVKITFTPTGGGAGTDAFLVYLFNDGVRNQLSGILPSTVAAGNYNVTVTNGTVSAPFAAQVLASKVSLFTQDTTGSGLASVQNFISQGAVDLNRLTTGSVSGTTISPAKPGQFMLAYGTGLGPLAAGDNSTSGASFDFSTHGLNVQAVVGGVSIPVAYAGRAGFPGEDQINFALPSNIPTGCAVSFQLSVNGVLSPATSIAIAPNATATACVIPGYTTQQLQSLDQGNSIVTGGFSITQFGITIPSVGAVKSNSVGGGFVQITGFQLAAAAQVNASVIQSGSCQVIQSTSSGTTATAGGNLTYLDAGAVNINGPAGSGLTNQALTKTNNIYSISSTEGFSIPGQLNFTLPAGTYALSGAGGPDVGSFNTSLALSSPLTVTGGLPANVPRSSPLTINWTGGNASDSVEIIGGGSTTSGTGSSATTTSTSFICLTTAGPGTFTVPSSILSQLPVSTSTSTGILELASGNFNSTFTASLPKIGGSVTGVFSNFVGTGAQVNWQ